MKLKIVVALFVTAQTLLWYAGAQTINTNKIPPTQRLLPNATRIWTLKQGGKIEGWFGGFQGTNVVIVRKVADNRNYSLTISALSKDDQVYLATLRDAALKTQLDAEVKQMERDGSIELTRKLIENFPEKVDQKQGWMDAEFLEIDSSVIGIYLPSMYKDYTLAFRVNDKNGDHFSKFYAKKDRFSDLLLKLKRGDRIRVKGKVVSMGTSVHWIYVDSIKLTSPATHSSSQGNSGPGE